MRHSKRPCGTAQHADWTCGRVKAAENERLSLRERGKDGATMGRAQRIIDLATRDPRLKSSSAFSNKVYRDEPVLMTASQMRQFLPQKYRDMRAIASSPSARGRSADWVFARQARFMADFEDDYCFDGEFVRYYPTYQSMTDEQLRGYFSWRTRFRHGESTQVPTSFAFVYIYELINGVGAASAEEGFHALRDFMETRGEEDEAVHRYLRRWLVDYAVWHGIDAELLDGLVESGVEEAIQVFEDAASLDVSSMSFGFDLRASRGTEAACMRPGSLAGEGIASRPRACLPESDSVRGQERFDPHSRRTPWDELYDAAVMLSTYRIESSRLFKEYPNEFRRALCGVCATLAAHCAKHRKTSFAKGLFGTFRNANYEMFQNAVFYDDGRHPDATYRLPDGRVFYCRYGRWMQRRRGVAGPGPKLGAIIKAVDACLREELGECGSLKHPALPKYMERIVRDQAASAVKWEREHAPLKLSFDASRISGIRSAASLTCEALLVEEEREDAGFPGSLPAKPEDLSLIEPEGPSSARPEDFSPGFDAAASEADGPLDDGDGLFEDPSTPSPLDGGQRAWVGALLAGDSRGAARAIRESGLTDDLMADAVNEALFDFLGDTAVEFVGDGYAVVDDYREDVEGLVR